MLQYLQPLLFLLLNVLAFPLPLLDLGPLSPGHPYLLHLLPLLPLVVHPLLDIIIRGDEVSLINYGREVIDEFNGEGLRLAPIVLVVSVHTIHELKHAGEHCTRRLVVCLRIVVLGEQVEGHLKEQQNIR
jgi:hypothetical protein